MKVLKIKDPTKIENIVTIRGNRAIIPVNDGNGDLVIGKEVLFDKTYSDLVPTILAETEEVEYVPLPSDEKELEAKFVELGGLGKLIKVDLKKREIEYDSKVITPRSNRDGDNSTKTPKGIINKVMAAGRAAVNWVVELFT